MSKTHTQMELGNVDIELTQGSSKQAMKEVGASSRDLWFVDRESIKIIKDFNTRIQGPALQAHIRNLANSMKAEGFYPDKPLAGYVAREADAQVIYITDGHCRLDAYDVAASEGAELGRLPVVVSAQGTSVEDLTVALVRSNSGKPLEPYELAIVCKRLSRFSWEVDEIAHRLGFTKTYVDNLLLLISSPIAIRQMVMDGKLSATTAVEAIKQHGDKATVKLQAALEQAQSDGKERVTKRLLPPKPEAAFKKQVTRAAPELYNSLRDITMDAGYKQLSPELRTKLDALMREFTSIENANIVPFQALS